MVLGDADNPYGILGVSSTATQDEIQAAYKRLARTLHPDVNRQPDAEDRFKRVVAAYDLLKDEKRRARYDAFGRRGRRRTRYEDVRTGTEDLRRPWDRGRRFEVQLRITLAEAYTGTSATLQVPGRRPSSPVRPVKIRVPAGAKDGDRLHLEDPKVVVRLSVDCGAFEVDGLDVRGRVRVAPWEAALGATLDYPGPRGILRLKVPAGTSSGTVLRLRHQGLPPKPERGGDPGHLYVDVGIAMPKALTEREQRLYEELARSGAVPDRT